MLYNHYQETEELIELLVSSSLKKQSKALRNAMDAGATGAEVFMALRWNIDQTISNASISGAIATKAIRLRDELDTCLK